MILQLNPQIPVYLDDFNSLNETGRAIGWIDYSEENNLLWIVALDSNGTVWIVPNHYVRLQFNISLGRVKDD